MIRLWEKKFYALVPSRQTIWSACVLVVCVAFGMQASPARAQANNYFQGKTIRLLLPTSPGGGRSLYALPFAAIFSRHIPGRPDVQPVFMPGAGGSVAADYAYNVAAPDGLTLLSPLKSLVISQAVGDPSVKYDVRKFNWVGRITDATQIFFVSNKVKVRSFTDFKTTPIILSSTGYSSPTYQLAVFSNKVLGTKFHVITGYQSASNMNMAVDQGESQGAFTTWNDLDSYHSDWVRDGQVKVLLQIAIKKSATFGKVPLMSDLAPQADRELCDFMSSSSDLGESIAAPPGVPADVLKILRKAFDETVKDPFLVDKFRSMRVQFDPMSGAQLGNLVLQTINAPANVVARYKDAIKPQ